ncbi:MAG: amino acid ABC transporter permease [Tissierellia bacterium]|nr:amino acid ABC transporter permease [Tissierellia bacterium]
MNALTEFFNTQISFIQKFGVAYLFGALRTLELSAIGVVFGFILGLLISLAALSNNKILKKLSKAYVEIIRGTPMLVQLMIVYFGLSSIIPESLGILRNKILLCSMAVSLNSAAYIAEVIRGGINSIDKGQMEAARSLGLNYKQSMKEVIIPQAIKNILPALVNEFIALIKETSIVFTVGVSELMFVAKAASGSQFNAVRPLLYVAFVYFILTYSLSKFMGKLERRLNVDKN